MTSWARNHHHRVAVALVAGALLAAAAWRLSPARARPRETYSEPDGAKALTIFVSVASYRDRDCAGTLKSMFSKARHPGRVFAGVCEQNSDDAKEACLPAAFEWHDQVRRVSVPHREAKGPTYARYLCATLYRGEAYFLQVDSHTRFVQDWDVHALEVHRSCPRPDRAVLTHYPHDWGLASKTRDVPVLCKSKFDKQGLVTFDAVVMPAAAKPRPVPFTAGGFLFGPGAMVTRVPYDPALPHLFQGEELLYSARLWTHGFDFFTPTRNLVFHHYHRNEASRFWDDVDYAEEQAATVKKVKALLAGELEGYSHGMGPDRTLDEYWEFAGIDWEASETTSADKFCT